MKRLSVRGKATIVATALVSVGIMISANSYIDLKKQNELLIQENQNLHIEVSNMLNELESVYGENEVLEMEIEKLNK